MKTIPDPIDVHVGARLKFLRVSNKASQMRLAEHLGISFQQVQKYEKGTNRISASRLMDICSFFGVPPSYLFNEQADATAPVGSESSAKPVQNLMSFIATSEGIELNREFLKIGNAQVRRQLIALVSSIADDQEMAVLPVHDESDVSTNLHS